MKWFASLSTAAIPKRRFGHPSPQHPGSIEPNKPSEKEAHPRTNLKPAAFRSMLAFRSALMPTWCLIRLVLMFRPAVTITPINALAPKSWCPHPPGGHAWSRSLMSAWTLAPSFRSAVTFRLALMLTWCSCSTRCSRETAAAHTVHGPQELIPHGRNRAACMISGLPTRNRAFAGKILTLCIPNRLIASRNAYISNEFCQESGYLYAFSEKGMHATRFLPTRTLKLPQCSGN